MTVGDLEGRKVPNRWLKFIVILSRFCGNFKHQLDQMALDCMDCKRSLLVQKVIKLYNRAIVSFYIRKCTELSSIIVILHQFPRHNRFYSLKSVKAKSVTLVWWSPPATVDHAPPANCVHRCARAVLSPNRRSTQIRIQTIWNLGYTRVCCFS